MKIYDTTAVYDAMNLNQQLSAQFQPIHEAMTRNYNMTVPGLQWDDDVKATLDAQGRPAYSYNIITNAIRFAKQLEEGGRKGVAVMPVGEEDYDASELFEKLIMHFLKKTNFDYQRGRAFLDAIIARFGIVYSSWSYTKDPEGSFIVQAIDPRRIMFDLDYSDPTMSNVKYMQDRYRLTIEDMIMKYAFDNPELQDAIIQESRPYIMSPFEDRSRFLSSRLKSFFGAFKDIIFDSGRSTDNSNLNTNSAWFNPSRLTFDVIETHEKRMMRRVLFYDPATRRQIDATNYCTKDNAPLLLDAEKITQFKKEHGFPYDPEITVDNMLWINAVAPALGIQLYDAPYPVQNGQFMFTILTANNFHADMALSQSLVDDLVDPQSDFNKARSTQLELLSRYVNAGWVVEDGAIDGFEEDWTSANLAPYRRVNTGYFGKVQPEQRQTIAPDLIREINQVPLLAEYISNVNKAARGESEGAGESGRHFIARRQQAERSFSNLMGNLDIFSKMIYKNCLDNIQHFLTVPRAIRIVGENGQQETLYLNQKQLAVENGRIVEKVLNDITVGKYDIEISPAPYSATAREMEFLKFLDIFNVIAGIDPQAAQKLIPILIQASDTSYRTEMLRALGEDEETQQSISQKQQQIQMLQDLLQRITIRGKELENQEKQLENLNKYLDAVKKGLEIKDTKEKMLITQLINQSYPQQGAM